MPTSRRARKSAADAERVRRLQARLDVEFEAAHTIATLARSVGMSAFHFSRAFAEVVGKPPHRYLRDIRLDAARAMLRTGSSVTAACHGCGFNNLSHFSRSFSARFGVPPSRWRADVGER